MLEIRGKGISTEDGGSGPGAAGSASSSKTKPNTVTAPEPTPPQAPVSTQAVREAVQTEAVPNPPVTVEDESPAVIKEPSPPVTEEVQVEATPDINGTTEVTVTGATADPVEPVEPSEPVAAAAPPPPQPSVPPAPTSPEPPTIETQNEAENIKPNSPSTVKESEYKQQDAIGIFDDVDAELDAILASCKNLQPDNHSNLESEFKLDDHDVNEHDIDSSADNDSSSSVREML